MLRPGRNGSHMNGDYAVHSAGFLQRTLPRSRRGKANALTILAAIAITIILSTTIPHFLRLGNILNILEQLSILGFMSIGMTFVMVSGGIDLSTYTIVSAASVVGATAMVSGYSPLLGCALMAVVGLAFGSINGVAIAFGRMIPFIVTLSTMVVAQGFAIWFTQAQSISGLPDSYVDAVSGKIFDVIPIPAVIIIVVAVISGVILARTQYGRWLYLTGTNEAAAAISGIPVRLTKFLAYVFSGVMAGITAIVLTAMVGTATTAMVRDERLMDVIATTVIGGASLKGGSGSVLGTMVGLLFVTVLSNSFNLLGISPFVAIVIKGAVLVLVIGLDTLRSK
jgi:ribose/xylose/arabinose/galactoside ABC-type transport system permease subunit